MGCGDEDCAKGILADYRMFILHFVWLKENDCFYTDKMVVIVDCFFSDIIKVYYDNRQKWICFSCTLVRWKPLHGSS